MELAGYEVNHCQLAAHGHTASPNWAKGRMGQPLVRIKTLALQAGSGSQHQAIGP
jgi:hypothetical protein